MFLNELTLVMFLKKVINMILFRKFFLYTLIIITSIIFSIKLLDISIGILIPYTVNKNKTDSKRFLNLRERGRDYHSFNTPSDLYLSDTENLIKKPYELKINKDGFIVGPNDSISKNDNKIDIIFLAVVP